MGSDVDGSVCPICLEDMRAPACNVKLHACGHVFHAKCMRHFIEFGIIRGGTVPSCPVCRAGVTASDVSSVLSSCDNVSVVILPPPTLTLGMRLGLPYSFATVIQSPDQMPQETTGRVPSSVCRAFSNGLACIACVALGLASLFILLDEK
jgi:hypothetical protein